MNFEAKIPDNMGNSSLGNPYWWWRRCGYVLYRRVVHVQSWRGFTGIEMIIRCQINFEITAKPDPSTEEGETRNI